MIKHCYLCGGCGAPQKISRTVFYAMIFSFIEYIQYVLLHTCVFIASSLGGEGGVACYLGGYQDVHVYVCLIVLPVQHGTLIDEFSVR